MCARVALIRIICAGDLQVSTRVSTWHFGALQKSVMHISLEGCFLGTQSWRPDSAEGKQQAAAVLETGGNVVYDCEFQGFSGQESSVLSVM